ncbi:MAG TPA: hypothetical protein VGR70_18530, partial [Stellaceae bacterium]|nr:hypothetical protein [Stellaceae bacterium]
GSACARLCISSRISVILEKVMGAEAQATSNARASDDYANDNGAVTLGLCGGTLKGLAQHNVWANVNDMQLCEDAHAIFCHIVMQRLCGMM